MELKSIDLIFWDAAQIASEAKRSAYLERVCGDDVLLHQRVVQLMKVRSQADTLLEPCAAASLDEPLRTKPGTFIGPYKLLEQTCEGGMEGNAVMARVGDSVMRNLPLGLEGCLQNDQGNFRRLR